MMKKESVVLLVLGLWLSGCASNPETAVGAQNTTSKAEESVQPQQDEENKPLASIEPVKVCKNYAPTGSRIGKRVCRTQAAWDEIERVAKKSLDNSTKPQSSNQEGL